MENEDLMRIKQEIRMKRLQNRQTPSVKKKRPFWFGFVTKLLLTVILTLGCMIVLKNNRNFKTLFYKQVYDTNFSFAMVNNWYEKSFGSPLPFKNLWQDKITPVFKEKLIYKEANLYKDGVKLTVEENYLVPALGKGLVIFVGDKENYPNTVIIQQSDGVDVWYSNIEKLNIKLYDYIEQGALLGEAKEKTLYLNFKKDGKVLNYKDFLA